MDYKAAYHKAMIAEALELLDSDETATIAHLRPGLRRYLEDKIETGGFLRRVLENDLSAAIMHAHPSLRMDQMKTLVEMINGSFPARSWGSPEAVKDWLEEGAASAAELAKGQPKEDRQNMVNTAKMEDRDA